MMYLVLIAGMFLLWKLMRRRAAVFCLFACICVSLLCAGRKTKKGRRITV
ncbi:MAG: hypothetical protein K6A40_01290 [Solobacterium sp.]|nr:hypothetical protein [Solobacterium sp.]